MVQKSCYPPFGCIKLCLIINWLAGFLNHQQYQSSVLMLNLGLQHATVDDQMRLNIYRCFVLVKKMQSFNDFYYMVRNGYYIYII